MSPDDNRLTEQREDDHERSQLTRMMASGYLAGGLAGVAGRGQVQTVTDDAGNYTGEVRYQFMDRWWTVTPQEVPSDPG